MVALGLTPLAAIQAGTINAAEALGGSWRDRVGRIAPGLLADLIAVEGNPLADIATLEGGVRFVMVGGRVVRRD